MITIEEVIQYFEQDFTTGSTWDFKESKAAAAVVRAQHKEIERLRAEVENSTRAVWKLYNERDDAYERAAQTCDTEHIAPGLHFATCIRALKSGEPK